MRRADTSLSNSTQDDDAPDEKVLVYNFKANRLSVMSRQELYRKAGDSPTINSIKVPARPGRLTIRLKDGEKGVDTYIATVNIRWQWRCQRWVGNFKELYVAGSL